MCSHAKPTPVVRRPSQRSPPPALQVLIAGVMGLQHALAMIGGLITPPLLIGALAKNGDTQRCECPAPLPPAPRWLLLPVRALNSKPAIRPDKLVIWPRRVPGC